MTTTLPYKVLDLSPHDEEWSAYLENVLLQQAEEGWELVTGFQSCSRPRQYSTDIQTSA